MSKPELSSEAGQELIRARAEARKLTDELFRVVRPDSMYERPIPERHRIILRALGRKVPAHQSQLVSGTLPPYTCRVPFGRP